MNLAASFQKTVEEILYKKTKIAFVDFEKNKVKIKNFCGSWRFCC